MAKFEVPVCVDRRAAVAREVGTSADDFSPAELQILADGPILSPLRIYLPAGRLSMDAWRRREARIMAGYAE